MDGYKIAVGKGGSLPVALNELVEHVIAEIAEGWQPTGGVTIDRATSMRGENIARGLDVEIFCLQPLVR